MTSPGPTLPRLFEEKDAGDRSTPDMVRPDATPRRTVIWIVADGARLFARGCSTTLELIPEGEGAEPA